MPLFGMDFSKLGNLFKRQDERPTPQPRKGIWPFLGNTVNKKQQRVLPLNAEVLGRLAKSDPITFAIIRTIKAYINQAEWDIEVDTEEQEKELDRWEEYALSHLSPYAIGELADFESEVLDRETIREVESRLKAIMQEPTDFSEKKKAIQWFFSSVIRKIKAEAEKHRWPVKKILESPSPRGLETNFRALQELVLNDLLIFDAGCIVKNYNRMGELAELYHIPGKDVRRYMNPDRTIPESPEPAYVWEDGGIIRAQFSRDELVYMMQYPQADGYGLSPIQIAAYVITASLYVDEYNLDFFKNSNVPPGVFDLGKDVTDDQRMLFQQMWDAEVRGRGGLHRMPFISGSEDAKFIPFTNMTNRDMQMVEYMKWTLAVKTACYGLSGQDIGFVVDYHRTTGETQRDISHARGIRSVLGLLSQYYNSEIVKKEFGYNDVKFAWKDIDVTDEDKEATIDAKDIDQGVMTRNDRRKKLGMKPIEGGDVATVTMAGQLVPVSELQQYEEGREDIEEQAQNTENVPGGAQPENLTETPQPGSPEAQEVQGEEAGNDTIPPVNTPQPNQQPPQLQQAKKPQFPGAQKAAPTESVVNVKMNRRVPVKKQQAHLDSVVKELQKQGINATIKIGFEDGGKK